MFAESQAMMTTTMAAALAPQKPHTVVVQVASSMAATKTTDDSRIHKKNRIQVSNTKKPLFFYLNLAKRYIKQHNEVELTALGMAIPTAVTVAEILKANGIAVEKEVLISTIGTKDANKGRLIQKAKLVIVLQKNDNAVNQKATPETLKAENQKIAPETEIQKTATEAAKTESNPDEVAKTEKPTTEPKGMQVAEAISPRTAIRSSDFP